MKKISKVLKGARRSNNVNFLASEPELPYAEKLSRKQPSGRTKSTPSSSAEAEADQLPSK